MRGDEREPTWAEAMTDMVSAFCPPGPCGKPQEGLTMSDWCAFCKRLFFFLNIMH